MANKTKRETESTHDFQPGAFAQLQEAGLGNMVGMSTAWVETLSEIGAEAMSFVAERIKEDVKTQHEILHCKNIGDLQHIQARFLQRAIDQYQAETGKIIDMGTSAFKPDTSD